MVVGDLRGHVVPGGASGANNCMEEVPAENFPLTMSLPWKISLQ